MIDITFTKMHKVYLLKSQKDNNYYIGQTDNIVRRLKEHNDGKSKSTKARRPFDLIGYEEYSTQAEARFREYQLKNKPRLKKEFIVKLMSGYKNREKASGPEGDL